MDEAVVTLATHDYDDDDDDDDDGWWWSISYATRGQQTAVNSDDKIDNDDCDIAEMDLNLSLIHI